MKLTLNTSLNILKNKGNLAYKYNPFYNYLINENAVVTTEGYLVTESKAIDIRNGNLLIKKDSNWTYNGEIISSEYVLDYTKAYSNDSYTKIDANSLIDLNTKLLNFDLYHPVNIEVLPSYDGSVNLILNDGKNIPRLINSRFSVREKNTYEIVDRIGENDTNVYSSDNFDKDTSLYFLYKINPKITYSGLINGNLPVGQYCFYFTYADADGNESDYIAESGLIPVFIGMDNDPFSMDGGIKNLNSNKGIKLKLNKVDSSYNYLKVYYIRYFADYLQNRVVEFKEIILKYSITNLSFYIQITGDENTNDLDPTLLNISKFNPKNVKTLTQCKNMLFFGNIVKNYDNYKELSDCALRIIPEAKEIDKSNFTIDNNYYNLNFNNEYYNSYNMYNKVGYFNGEYYRFGVVFIYNNGMLSNVYNISGYNFDNLLNYNSRFYKNSENGDYERQYIKVDDNGWIVDINNEFTSGVKINARGVCKFPSSNVNASYSIKFNIDPNVKDFLKKELGIRGLFFVRQKRIPKLLGQCYILPMDNVLHAPILKVDNSYYTESFISLYKTNEGTRIVLGWEIPYIYKTGVPEVLTSSYEERLIDYSNFRFTAGDSLNRWEANNNLVKSAIDKKAFAGICPDFLLNLPYYNQIFNGSKFKFKKVTNTDSLKALRGSKYRIYDTNLNYDNTGDNKTISNVSVCTVTEDLASVALDNKIYQLEIGKAEEAYRFGYAGADPSLLENNEAVNVNKCLNIVRGKYSPYLAIYDSTEKLEAGTLYNIYQDNEETEELEFLNRMNTSFEFYSISDRYNFEDKELDDLQCFRGDCYSNTFTYRLNRNFNDPSLPNNDTIIDVKTWQDNYMNSLKFQDISRSDVNAVPLGSWITLKVLSSYNYALRSEDKSYVSEAALMGSPRTFYPKKQALWLGNYKMPDSYLYNDAYRASLGYKCYFTIQDVNYVKNSFSNRIQYSAIAILDSYKNNYRDSLSTYYRDYSQEYGGITKLIGMDGYLLVVFEHAIGLLPVNERVLAASGEGEPVYINTKNVLPELVTVITDTYGSLWQESVIKTEAGYVYGIDTVAKKIWRIKGQQIELISDFKVNKFLVDNLTLKERELTPIIGLRNVKTHYNNNKKDVMFTFYNRVLNKDVEEVAWNLCFNELLDKFVTYYSWIPSYSENIDTQFFTFNREPAKYLSYLNKCNASIDSNTGVLVDGFLGDGAYKFIYKSPSDGTIYFRIEKDHFGYYKQVRNSLNLYVTTVSSDGFYLGDSEDAKSEVFYNLGVPVIFLLVTPIIDGIDYPTEMVAISCELIFYSEDKKFNTDFYLHGRAGIIDVKEEMVPTNWYGEYHPFEFEFIVNDNVGKEKIFSNLVIISNKAEPESFHFEIEGDGYEFSSDKRTMYYRLEKTKNLYQNMGSNILYDRKYTDVMADKFTLEQTYRAKDSEYTKQYSKKDKVYPVYKKGLLLQVKSTIFPLYYEKVDTYDTIYHLYREMVHGEGYDYKNLSGSELVWNRDLNLFNIVTHIKNNPVTLYGRVRGNSYYKEGKWNILIPSIIFSLKNEPTWEEPPIVLNSAEIPNDIESSTITYDMIPNCYDGKDIRSLLDSKWTARKEAKIKDKWIKIRIRYSGNNLAIIHSVITLYNMN